MSYHSTPFPLQDLVVANYPCQGLTVERLNMHRKYLPLESHIMSEHFFAKFHRQESLVDTFSWATLQIIFSVHRNCLARYPRLLFFLLRGIWFFYVLISTCCFSSSVNFSAMKFISVLLYIRLYLNSVQVLFYSNIQGGHSNWNKFTSALGKIFHKNAKTRFRRFFVAFRNILIFCNSNFFLTGDVTCGPCLKVLFMSFIEY